LDGQLAQNTKLFGNAKRGLALALICPGGTGGMCWWFGSDDAGGGFGKGYMAMFVGVLKKSSVWT
jgi:hypothetical protein